MLKTYTRAQIELAHLRARYAAKMKNLNADETGAVDLIYLLVGGAVVIGVLALLGVLFFTVIWPALDGKATDCVTNGLTGQACQ